MITLITGVPGAGKTCYSMAYLLEARSQNRPLFVHGIPDLKIEHTPVYCSALSCKVCQDNKPETGEILLAEDWDKWAPDGAYVVIDEVQNVYRPRKQGAIAPTSVMAFETHRHSGIDFLLLSQSPMLFDTNIRRLIGKHIHLKANWAARNQYEWQECQEQTKSLAGAVKTSYKLEKKNFDLYKSAEMHTKQKKKIPPALFGVAAALVLSVFLGFRVYGSISTRMDDDLATQSDAPAALGSLSGDRVSNDSIIPAQYDYLPLVANHPESAPAFVDLVEVVSYPRVSACVYLPSRNDCRCYTQQATLVEVEYLFCRNYVRERPFNPYLEDMVEQDESRGTGSE